MLVFAIVARAVPAIRLGTAIAGSMDGMIGPSFPTAVPYIRIARVLSVSRIPPRDAVRGGVLGRAPSLAVGSQYPSRHSLPMGPTITTAPGETAGPPAEFASQCGVRVRGSRAGSRKTPQTTRGGPSHARVPEDSTKRDARVLACSRAAGPWLSNGRVPGRHIGSSSIRASSDTRRRHPPPYP